MRFSYLCFAVAFVCLIATAGYRDALVAAGVFAGVGAFLLWFERRKVKASQPRALADTGYWKCPKCSTINPAFAKSCTKCGTAVGGALQP